MIKKYLLWGTALTATALVFMSASSGPAAALSEDKTNSPLSSGNCNGCHGGASNSVSIVLSVKDGANAVTSYEPGKTYTLEYGSIGNHNAYGIQMCVLNGSNQITGTLAAGTGTKVTTLNSKRLGEHTAPSVSPNFTFSWTAPAKGTGSVTIYSSMIGADNMGGTGNDATAVATTVLTESNTGSLADKNKPSFNVYPNPCSQWLKVEGNQAESFQIFDLLGKELSKGSIINQTIDLSNLNTGMYLVKISNEVSASTFRIQKI